MDAARHHHGHEHHHHPSLIAREPAGDAAVIGAPAGTIYTCPMHPEIRQDHPGNCPKCGMTLEPVMPSLEDGNTELNDFRRRFWWTLPLTVVVTLLAMFGHSSGWLDMAAQSWGELALAVPIVLWAGWPFFVRGAQSIVKRSPNMWTLISLGTGKTGTLTEGRPAFERAVAAHGFDEREVLRLAASLDQASEHPLAAAIVAAAREQGLSLPAPQQFESASGIGVSGVVEHKRLALGNTALMQQLGVAVIGNALRLRGRAA